ncbi:MAG: S41 family peptidase, partial [Anaerolineales bacterium]
MEKMLRTVFTCGLAVVLGIALFASGFAAGHVTAQPGSPLPQLAGSPPVDGDTPAELRTTFAPFWEAWDIVHDEYVDQPLDDTELMRGAIEGMMKALDDPHSSYMDPASYRIATTDQSGELEGIGALVEQSGDYLRIISPMPGSPAEAAGLLSGDLIIKVNDTDIAGMNEFEAIALVRGPAGSNVRLTIQREDADDLLEFDIVRAKIIIPSVESKMLDGNLAYVKINNFGEKTTPELREALRSTLAQKPVGMVLDLRGNPGGFLNTAIDVVSQFIPDGVVMIERYGDGREVPYRANDGGLATDIPLVVLIDQ